MKLAEDHVCPRAFFSPRVIFGRGTILSLWLLWLTRSQSISPTVYSRTEVPIQGPKPYLARVCPTGGRSPTFWGVCPPRIQGGLSLVPCPWALVPGPGPWPLWTLALPVPGPHGPWPPLVPGPYGPMGPYDPMVQCQRPNLGQAQIWARSKFGLGPVWGPNPPWKNMVLLGDGFEGQVFRLSRMANGSPGVKDPFGRASLPPNPPKPQFLGKFQG